MTVVLEQGLLSGHRWGPVVRQGGSCAVIPAVGKTGPRLAVCPAGSLLAWRWIGVRDHFRGVPSYLRGESWVFAMGQPLMPVKCSPLEWQTAKSCVTQGCSHQESALRSGWPWHPLRPSIGALVAHPCPIRFRLCQYYPFRGVGRESSPQIP
jgi:hypothetical protein